MSNFSSLPVSSYTLLLEYQLMNQLQYGLNLPGNQCDVGLVCGMLAYSYNQVEGRRV